jgi:hypothetical protein
MAINRERARQWLKAFDFRKLFIEELGWDNFARPIVKQIDGTDYCFQAVAQKRGVAVLVSDSIPDYAIRVKLDKLIAKDHFEHLIVFTDQAHGRQVWQWVRKEPGKPTAVRTYHYSPAQSGELLFQKLDSLVFTLEEEEILTLTSVTGRLKTFDVEKVTKKFYERFKTEHATFLKFIQGIPDKQMESWYASVMVNRLMFLYFIQEKGFLNGDKDYLRNKLAESRDRKPDAYYRDFLCPLFFQGFARKKAERSAATNKLLGEIPYLNGGLFQKHQIEEQHGKTIVIADTAFEKLFSFFKEYDWHLDERENRNGNEINPDVLGYIFEKYINQKQMGAYYTKEDITEYIAQNTIIPFLLDEARKGCAVAFAPDGSVWRLLRDDPNRYIHDAMKKGADLPLPTEIEAGVADVQQRGGWNRKAPEEFALPTEIWREAIDRQQRYRAVKAKLAAGEVHQVNDLVTLNLNIRQFAQDVIQFCEGPELLRAVWKAIEKVSVLDPTCGSGAFLFAALNILKPLYEACLIRMQGFIEDMESAGPHHPAKFSDFKQILEESKRHPKQDYFILKAIIVNNLFGVDIMEEAVEICKLRLFLKLVAQVESQDRIEPLPDIDFNIRAGNTLVGYARYEDVKKAVTSKFDFGDAMSRIEDKAKVLDSAVELFRKQQTQLDGTVTAEDKAELRRRFSELEEELNDHLSGEYGVKKSGIEKWKESYKPFHWFSDFHRVLSLGGFDVIIGNPPYVESAKIKDTYKPKGLSTADSGNLYGMVAEVAFKILGPSSRLGLIIPMSVVSTARMESVRNLLFANSGTIHLSHYSGNRNPSVLFDGVEMRLTICFAQTKSGTSDVGCNQIFSTEFRRWAASARAHLFTTTRYANVPTRFHTSSLLPKFGSETEEKILQRILDVSGNSTIGIATVSSEKHSVYAHRIASYFVKGLTFIPRFSSERDGAKKSEDYKVFSFQSKAHASAACCLINSSLFYFYFIVFSDAYHCGRELIEQFPVNIVGLSSALSDEIQELERSLMFDLKKNSDIRKIAYKSTGMVEMQKFFPKLSKPILDKIDSTLARYYGFTDEELDFIINYDIKYRLGADADEDEE